MRDILLAIVFAVLLPMSCAHPWIGSMAWTFVSLNSPHKLTFGFMYDAPLGMLTAAATLFGMLLSKDPKRLPKAAPLAWLAGFSAWVVIAYPFSLVPGAEVNESVIKLLKIFFMTFVTVAVIHTRRQVDVLIAVVALSIGFYGIKGGIFALMTGGQFQVRGSGGFIGSNNELGLALVMIIPLLYYLVLQQQKRLWRWGLIGAGLLCAIAAVSTQSRGAFLAIVAMGITLALRSPEKKRVIFIVVLCAAAIPAFMPDAWWDRMQTIQTYDEDASAQGRINAWEVAFRIASSHFFGGGLFYETDQIFAQYARNQFVAVAHSIYFQVLGQLGFVGLFIYVGLWGSTVGTLRWLDRNARSLADWQLSRMIEISFAGFAVGGAFLNFAYFDGPYYLLAALVVVRWKLLGNQALPKSRAAATAAGQDRLVR